MIEGPLDVALREQRYAPFYMHKTSHWLGLDVHDCGDYVLDGKPRPLEPGMVLTVEPGLYVGAEAEVDAAWRGIGIRIEDDVLVTKDGHEVLTSAVPKAVEAVEALCQGRELVGQRRDARSPRTPMSFGGPFGAPSASRGGVPSLPGPRRGSK